MLNGKHKFTQCTYCFQSIFFEDSRKRIESGKWVHANCFNPDVHKPYPEPHQVANGMKHKSTNGNGSVNSQTATTERPQGILETILAEHIQKNSGISEDRVRQLIAESNQPKTIQLIKPDGARKEIKGTHFQFEKLLKLIGYRKHCYLYGSPGSGKSTAARQCADALEIPYAYSSLNPQTPESRLIGFMHAGGQYVETDFYRCYKNGGVYCLDEMDNASPSLLNTLNSLLENGHGSFPCGMIARHADFVLVATGNTNGKGANIQFPDRRAFDSAFSERFKFLAWEYDEAMEQNVTLSINPNAKQWLSWVKNVRTHVLINDIRLVVSPRASFEGALLLTDEFFSVEEIAEMVVFKGLEADTKYSVLRKWPLPSRAK